MDEREGGIVRSLASPASQMEGHRCAHISALKDVNVSMPSNHSPQLHFLPTLHEQFAHNRQCSTSSDQCCCPCCCQGTRASGEHCLSYIDTKCSCSVRRQTEFEKRKAVVKLFMGMITATVKRNQVLSRAPCSPLSLQRSQQAVFRSIGRHYCRVELRKFHGPVGSANFQGCSIIAQN